MQKGISGVLIALLALFGIAGCGGGQSSLSRADYEQQLELVCNKGLKDREEFVAELSQKYERQQKKVNAQEQAENLRNLMAVYRDTTEEIADIGVPDQGEEKAKELVTAREHAIAKVVADPDSALPEISEIFAKPYQLAEEFEARSCAK